MPKGLGRGYFFQGEHLTPEPAHPRAVAFTDGQNLFHALSQDQDLSEVAEEIRSIAREQARWIKIASAFPTSPSAPNRRGIDKTDWIRIDRAIYDACLDRRDSRGSSYSRIAV